MWNKVTKQRSPGTKEVGSLMHLVTMVMVVVEDTPTTTPGPLQSLVLNREPSTVLRAATHHVIQRSVFQMLLNFTELLIMCGAQCRYERVL